MAAAPGTGALWGLIDSDVGDLIMAFTVSGCDGGGVDLGRIRQMMRLNPHTRNCLRRGSPNLAALVGQHEWTCEDLEYPGEPGEWWVLSPHWGWWPTRIRRLLCTSDLFSIGGNLGRLPGVDSLDWGTLNLARDTPLIPQSVTQITVFVEHPPAGSKRLDLSHHPRVAVATIRAHHGCGTLSVESTGLTSLEVSGWNGRLRFKVVAPNLIELYLSDADPEYAEVGRLEILEADWISGGFARTVAAGPIRELWLAGCLFGDGVFAEFAGLDLDVLQVEGTFNVDWGVLDGMCVGSLYCGVDGEGYDDGEDWGGEGYEGGVGGVGGVGGEGGEGGQDCEGGVDVEGGQDCEDVEGGDDDVEGSDGAD
jgi:hypothetical protein